MTAKRTDHEEIQHDGDEDDDEMSLNRVAQRLLIICVILNVNNFLGL